MICILPVKDGVATCDQCGAVRAGIMGERLIAECFAEGRDSKCRHLGEVVSSIKVACVSCDGAKQVDEPVHACAVRKRCLPFYRPTVALLVEWNERKPESDIYAICMGCTLREPLAASKD